MNINVVNGVAFGAAFQSPIAKKKNTVTCKSTKEERKIEYQKYLEKYNYINSKTKYLDNTALILFITSFFLKAQDIDLAKKLTTKQWFAAGALFSGIALMVISAIEQYKLSKEYNKEINK